MSGTILREKLARGDIITAPGIYDHMSLLIANKHGFDAHYASGYWGTASMLGLPDAGVAAYRDFITQFARFAENSSAPLIADADTGFGSIANLAHAVKGYQKAGIAAMQIEDQPYPKICGHVGRATAVPPAQMVNRMKVSVDARGDGDMLIIARSDARRTEGLNAAIDRLGVYGEAGADILFLEAPQNEDEIAAAAKALDKPLLLNAAHGGFTPILSPQEYQELGVRMVIYPAGPPLSAAYAAQEFYKSLKGGEPNPDHIPRFDFAEMSDLLGLNEIAALQDRYPDG